MADHNSTSEKKKTGLTKKIIAYQLKPFVRVKSSLQNSGVSIASSFSSLLTQFKRVQVSAVEQDDGQAAARFEALYEARGYTPEALSQQIRGFRLARWLSIVLCWVGVVLFFTNGILNENLYTLTFGCVASLLLTCGMALKALQCALYERQLMERRLFGFASFWARKNLISIIFS